MLLAHKMAELWKLVPKRTLLSILYLISIYLSYIYLNIPPSDFRVQLSLAKWSWPIEGPSTSRATVGKWRTYSLMMS